MTALQTYRSHLDFMDSSLSALDNGLKRADKYLGKLKKAVSEAEKAAKNSKDLNTFVTNMEKAVKVLKLFGPTKFVATGVQKIIDKVQDGTLNLKQATEEVKDALFPYKLGFNAMSVEIKLVRQSLANDMAQTDAILNSVDDTIDAVAQAQGNVPVAFAVLLEDLEDYLDSYNIQFSGSDLNAANANLTTMNNALDKAAEVLDVLEDVLSGLASVYSKVRGLEAPLNAIGDALEPFDWLLSKAEWLISKTLDPILDPIFEATGINALMDRIASSVTSLLPNVSLFNPFDNLNTELGSIFGTQSLGGEWSLPMLTDVTDMIDSFRAQIFGTADFLAPLDANGTDGFDFIAAWNRGGLLNTEHFGAGGGDIIAGGIGDDTLWGEAGNDLLIGGGGDDSLIGGLGLEDMAFFDGSLLDYALEEISGGRVKVTYIGDVPELVGEDTLDGVEYVSIGGTFYLLSDLMNADQIDYPVDGQEKSGTSGNDILLGDFESDTLYGLGGNDQLVGFGKQDLLNGGSGRDLVNYAAEGNAGGVTVILDPTLIGVLDQRTDIIEEVEDIIGSSGGDIIAGGAQASRFIGGDGDDRMFGGAWNDTLQGGLGSDTLVGGDGNDVIDAKGGGEFDQDLVVAGRGNDTIEGDVGTTVTYSDRPGLAALVPYAVDLLADLPTRIEVTRADENGTIEITKSFNEGADGLDIVNGMGTLYATASADLIRLSNAQISYYASAGDDVIRGWYPDQDAPPEEIFAPLIDAGTGNDNLATWTGDEHFVGGAGDDTFRIFNTLDFDLEPTEAGPRYRFLIGGTFDGYDPTLPFDFTSFSVEDAPGSEGYDVLDLTESDLFFEVDLSIGEMVGYRSQSDIDEFDSTLGRDAWFISGIDEIIGSAQSDRVTAGPGDLVFLGGEGNDSLYAYDDAVGDINAFGGAGDDQLASRLGVDTLSGGDGNDFIDLTGNLGGQKEFVYAGAGDDAIVLRFSTSGGIADVYGGDGTDYVSVGSLEEIFVDLGSDDYSVGSSFAKLYGVEHVRVGPADATITGDAGGNFIRTGAGEDDVTGGGGADVIQTGDGLDRVFGGAGDDIINPGSGGGLVVGGDGLDTLRFDFDILDLGDGRLSIYDKFALSDERDWVIDFTQGTAYRQADPETVLTFSEIESAAGSSGNDLLIGAEVLQPEFYFSGIVLDGAAGDDTIFGSDRADTLLGGDGNDTFYAGDGDDDIFIGRGSHVVNGDGGFDTIWLDENAISAVVNLADGYVAAFHEYTVPFFTPTPADPFEWQTARVNSIENLVLTSGADDYEGGNLDDTAYGQDGADTMFGGGGADTLDGGAGADNLNGGIGRGPSDMLTLNAAGLNDYLTAEITDMPTDSLRIEIDMRADFDDVISSCLFSYGVTGSTNEFTIFASEGGDNLRILINGLVLDTGIHPATFFDGEIHRLAVQWQAAYDTEGQSLGGEGGYLEIYIDGVLEYRVTDSNAPGDAATVKTLFSEIGGSGVLVIGQDQDGSTPGVPSSYQDTQAYRGEVGNIRIGTAFEDEGSFAAYATRELPPEYADTVIAEWNYNADENSYDAVTGPAMVITAPASNPSLQTVDAGDEIYGREGNDTISGGVGDDTLFGNEDDDLMFGGVGNDDIFGGEGRDTMWGGDGSDSIGGGSGADEAWGGSGNDTIYSGDGWDTVYGGDGADTLFTGRGQDQVFGGAGNDALGGVGGNDIVNGGAGNDSLYGAGGDDTLTGDVGADLIYAGTGNDIVYAGGWNDTVFGAAGNDLIYLGDGADRVDAGPGDDTAFGGAGDDVFVFRDGQERLEIGDFNKADDRLELDSALWNGTLTASDVVALYADDSGSDVIFTFGPDVLVLKGVDTDTDLETLIDIV